jgi:hypothetical protein
MAHISNLIPRHGRPPHSAVTGIDIFGEHPSGAKAYNHLTGFMYGLKPVPFKTFQSKEKA